VKTETHIGSMNILFKKLPYQKIPLVEKKEDNWDSKDQGYGVYFM